MSEKSDDRKIGEALNLLEEMAKSRKAELQAMVADKYANLEELLGSFANDLGSKINESYEEGKENTLGILSGFNTMVHRNPWPFIGGVALGGFVIGIFQRGFKKQELPKK